MLRCEDEWLKNVPALFDEDFMFWTEEHFKPLPNVIISNLRDVLLKKYVPIERRLELRMSTALAKYILNICTKAFKNNDSRPVFLTNDEAQLEEQAPTRCREEMNSIRLKNHNKDGENFDEDCHLTPSYRLWDVSKLFSNDCHYSGAPTEPASRMFDIFFNASHLCEVDTSSKQIMSSLMQTTFLKRPALVYFMVVVIIKAKSPDEAVILLGAHILDDRAKLVNDDIWLEESYTLIKMKSSSKNEEVTYEIFLKELCSQISELDDIRTISRHSSYVLPNTIAAVRWTEAFQLVYGNPRRELQVPNSALRSCALEADRAAFRSSLVYRGKTQH